MYQKPKSAGSVLFLVLWTLSLLATLSIVLSVTMRQKLTLGVRLEEREVLRLMAEAGVKKAISIVKEADDELLTFNSLHDEWSHNPDVFQDMPVGDGICRFVSRNYNPFTEDFSERFGMVDEESKININLAEETVIRRLFRVGLGLDEIQAQNLAATIVDWRDNDSQLSIPVGSAEDRFYRNLRASYEAKDKPFQLLEELLLIRDINEPLYDQIKDYVTIYGDGKVNVNTASPQVLLAIGLSHDDVNKFMLYRYGEDQEWGTEDDGVFPVASSIVPALSQAAHLTSGDLERISIVVDQHLKTQSSYFRIECQAVLREGGPGLNTMCVTNQFGEILYWREG